MDQQVKPCVDFYKYACGGWEKNTPIPPGFSYWDRTQELAYNNMYQLHRLLGINTINYLGIFIFENQYYFIRWV